MAAAWLAPSEPPKLASWTCWPGSRSWAMAYSPSSWNSFRLIPPATMPQVVSAPLIRPAPTCASSALTRPPIDVPNASTWLGRRGSTVPSTAASVPNWSLTAVSSAHSEPFGS